MDLGNGLRNGLDDGSNKKNSAEDEAKCESGQISPASFILDHGVSLESKVCSL